MLPEIAQAAVAASGPSLVASGFALRRGQSRWYLAPIALLLGVVPMVGGLGVGAAARRAFLAPLRHTMDGEGYMLVEGVLRSGAEELNRFLLPGVVAASLALAVATIAAIVTLRRHPQWPVVAAMAGSAVAVASVARTIVPYLLLSDRASDDAIAMVVGRADVTCADLGSMEAEIGKVRLSVASPTAASLSRRCEEKFGKYDFMKSLEHPDLRPAKVALREP